MADVQDAVIRVLCSISIGELLEYKKDSIESLASKIIAYAVMSGKMSPRKLSELSSDAYQRRLDDVRSEIEEISGFGEISEASPEYSPATVDLIARIRSEIEKIDQKLDDPEREQIHHRLAQEKYSNLGTDNDSSPDMFFDAVDDRESIPDSRPGDDKYGRDSFIEKILDYREQL